MSGSGPRRSLTHVGGDVTLGGEPDDARALGEALDVQPAGDDEGEPERADVHGFHVYPARMHPTTAARLVALAAREGDRVLDPFCGSGTVLVEALASGRHAVGTDLNPLAVRLSRLKLRDLTAEGRALLVAEASRARAVADERRKLRVGSSTRYPDEDVELFDPHVLLELDSLRVGVDAAEKSTREPLMLVLS
ncbi:MAG TPA: DNA methyltransferase, partial [Polyangiaceae bacterium]|nr:DNA methyltransferase [Polyangiaceae bacterium]